MTRLMTCWVWVSLVLLFYLPGCFLCQWFYAASAYPTDYFEPLYAAWQRARFALVGIGILLPLALVTYFRKSSAMAWPVRVLYLGAVGLAAAVLMIYWTTRFGHH